MKPTVRTRLLASTLLVGAAAFANPAFAQTTPGANAQGETGLTTSEAAPTEATSSGDIVVTGSLISNPNLISSAPVAVVGQEEVQLRQSNRAEEILKTIPGAVASVGSATNNGNGGSSFVDLRGLGSNRNVVLLDGKRIVPADLQGRTNLDNIPLALVERVDALTGGAATTYGADAVSGVVNFITRSDFAGIDASASEQITEKGDGNVVRADVTIGANFDDGRGNAVFSVGYQQADPVYQGARDFSFYNIDGLSAAPSAAGSTTAVPSYIQIAAANGGVALGQRQINPATGTLDTPFMPFNFNPYNVYQTPFKRYNMYGAGHYDISDNVTVYTRGLFSKNFVSTILAPGGVFAEQITFGLNNAFLPAAARTQICGTLGITTAQCGLAATATGPTDPNFRSFTAVVRRRTTELGPRLTTFTQQVFDYRAGVKIGLADNLSLDLNGSYGESENNQTVTGNIRTSRVRAAAVGCVNGVRDAAGNVIPVDSGCVPINLFGPDGSITPAAAAYIAGNTSVIRKATLAQGQALLSGDLGFSSPFADNPIGFAAGAEYRKYQAFQSSDTLSQTPGEISGAGSAPQNITGEYEVSEGYGELIAPLVTDKPGFKSLTIEGGIRYSKYKIFTAGSPSFNTTTYKAGGSWEPLDGLKFRGNYQRAVRAPNIGELFTPVQTNLTSISTDPCATVNAAGTRTSPAPSGNLLAVCLAQGANAGNVAIIAPPTAGQGNAQSGGNVQLGPEKSDSYTAGVVIQPRSLVPGLSITVDYYKIKIAGAIGTPTTSDAVSACFANLTAASATDPACTVIRRNPITGGLDGSLATTPGLNLQTSNLGRYRTDGIDVGANYRTDLGFAKLALSFQGNYTHSIKFQAVTGSPTSYFRECVGLFSNNCSSFSGNIQPKYSWSQRTTFTFMNNIDISLLWRHISAVKYEGSASSDPLVYTARGYTAANRLLFSGVITGQVGGADNYFNGKTVDFNKIGSKNYFDLTGRFGLGEHMDLTITAQNLFNLKPPITGANVGPSNSNSGNTYPNTYDALGRRYAIGARVKF